MTTASYLEHYLESLESLPVEQQRNFNLMRELDGRAQNIMQEIEQNADDFLKMSRGGNSDKKKELASKIQRLYSKAKEYADDKVQLAIQTYELVDKHIRRLDSDLARFESEIKNGGGVSAASPREEQTQPSVTKRGRKREKESKKSKAESEDKASKGESSSPARKRQKSEIVMAAEQAASAGSSGEVLDMPVDPNEPTYCICHQVSFGQMIACDNPECPIEWFHIGCMGLNQIPKGKWYCPKCQAARKK